MKYIQTVAAPLICILSLAAASSTSASAADYSDRRLQNGQNGLSFPGPFRPRPEAALVPGWNNVPTNNGAGVENFNGVLNGAPGTGVGPVASGPEANNGDSTFVGPDVIPDEASSNTTTSVGASTPNNTNQPTIMVIVPNLFMPSGEGSTALGNAGSMHSEKKDKDVKVIDENKPKSSASSLSATAAALALSSVVAVYL